MRPVPEPHLFVVLGGTGDLAARKLLPALFRLAAERSLDFTVLGVGTRDLGNDGFRRHAREALVAAGLAEAGAEAWCRDRVVYTPLRADGDYTAFAERLTELERERGLPGNRVFYLALPPEVFPPTITGLGNAGLSRAPGWTRLVVEKPFGRDLRAAQGLNQLVHRFFDESQVYRIDHYLGKETVQNLLVFRFANPLFESSWNRDRIDRVEITVAESAGVGSRARYYDGAGAVRDMLQSHLTQVLTLIAMEAPTSMKGDDVRAEKVQVLRSIRPLEPDRLVLGQYQAGAPGGEPLVAYRDSEGIARDSRTATYAAATLYVDNWRWQGVPFHLRTGKAMAQRLTRVSVTFRPPPICLYHGVADYCVAHSDVLHLNLQPDEGFSLEIEVKEPSTDFRLRTVPLRFEYSEAFGPVPEAYHTLLLDIMEGDHTLFVRGDEAEEAWRVYDSVLEADLPVHPYPAGSWGPPAARDLLVNAPNWAVGG